MSNIIKSIPISSSQTTISFLKDKIKADAWQIFHTLYTNYVDQTWTQKIQLPNHLPVTQIAEPLENRGKAPGHMSGQVPTTGGEEEPPTSSPVLLGATKVGLLPWSGAGWPTSLGFGSADRSRQPPGQSPATKAAGGGRRGEEDGGGAGRGLPRPLIFSLPFAKNRGWCKMSKK